MSEYKGQLKKVERLIRTARNYDEYENCHNLYEFLGIIDKKASPDEIKLIIGEKFKYFQDKQSNHKWGELAVKFIQARGAIEYMLLDKRSEYDNHLIDLKVKELRGHYISRTKRDDELDSKEKYDLIEEGKDIGLSETEIINIINKWIKDDKVREVEVHSSGSTSSAIPLDVLFEKYYEILGVTEDADDVQIKDAYESELKKTYRIRDTRKVETRRYELEKAWAFFKDPVKRREYKEKLKQPETPVPTGTPRLVVECKTDYTFRDIRRGAIINVDKIVIKNPEGGLLQGTIKSDVQWLEPDRNKILEKHEQELYVNILTSKIPVNTYDIKGTVTLDTNGGPPYLIHFRVILEGLEIAADRFRKTYVPLVAAGAGFINSFSNSPVSNFLYGAILAGLISYFIAKFIVKAALNNGLNIFKFPSILIQGAAVGVVILTIMSHSDDTRSVVKSTITAKPPQRQQVTSYEKLSRLDCELIKAIKNGNKTKALDLINKGADVNSFNCKRYSTPDTPTPLTFAASKGKPDIVKELLDNGANVNPKYDKNKFPPLSPVLSLAVQSRNVETVKVLLESGANFNVIDRNDFTPLELAIFNRNTEIEKLLRKAGAKKKELSQQERLNKALRLNARSGNRAMVVELLKQGADVNTQGRMNFTPLIWAAYTGKTEVVKVLLDNGAKINLRSKADKTPLMYAVSGLSGGNTETVKILLERGADVKASYKPNKNTALDIAKTQGNAEIVQLLKKSDNIKRDIDRSPKSFEPPSMSLRSSE